LKEKGGKENEGRRRELVRKEGGTQDVSQRRAMKGIEKKDEVGREGKGIPEGRKKKEEGLGPAWTGGRMKSREAQRERKKKEKEKTDPRLK